MKGQGLGILLASISPDVLSVYGLYVYVFDTIIGHGEELLNEWDEENGNGSTRSVRDYNRRDDKRS